MTCVKWGDQAYRVSYSDARELLPSAKLTICHEKLQTGCHTGRLNRAVWDVDMKHTEGSNIPTNNLGHI